MPLLASRSRRSELIRWALRTHRTAVVAWVLGSATVMAFYGTLWEAAKPLIVGAGGISPALQTTVDALRVFTGPGDGLATYGGYVTYKVLMYTLLMLCVYAGIMGSRAIRSEEERGTAATMLATGVTPRQLVRVRAAGFAISLAIIAVAGGAGTALGTVLAGEPDAGGALLSWAEMALTASVCYALGLCVSQVLRTARTAAGLTSLLIVGLFLLNNLAFEGGALGVARWLSPFAGFELSRALVPGVGVSLTATAALALVAVVLLAAAAAADARRDRNDVLLHRGRAGARQRPAVTAVRPSRVWQRDLWISWLREQPLGLAAWCAGVFSLEWIYVMVTPTVVAMAGQNATVGRIFGATDSAELTDRFIAYAGTIVAGVAVAFVIVQAARWVADIRSGRTEMLLAAGVSRLRLILEEAVALCGGVSLIAAASVAGIAVGRLGDGATADAAALLRVGGATVLLGLGVGGIALLLVTWLRGGVAIGVLSALAGASWLLVVVGDLARWPDAVMRISIFTAFGQPYLGPLEAVSLITLGGLAVAGTLSAVAVGRRAPAVT